MTAGPLAFAKGSDSSVDQEGIAELEQMVSQLTLVLEIAKKRHIC